MGIDGIDEVVAEPEEVTTVTETTTSIPEHEVTREEKRISGSPDFAREHRDPHIVRGDE